MGEWMSEGGTGTPHYVVNPDHVIRLQNEGYQIITDPRATTELKTEEPEQGSEAEDDTEKDEKVDDDDATRRLTAVKPAKGTRTRNVDTTP